MNKTTEITHWRGSMKELDKAYMAQRLDNFEWVIGFYICMRGAKPRHYIIPLGTQDLHYQQVGGVSVEVDVKTIEPARLVDMAGRTIDVGDIVKQRIMKLPSKVFFDCEESAFGMENANGTISMLSPRFTRTHLTVIGNIKDNPELMLGEIKE